MKPYLSTEICGWDSFSGDLAHCYRHMMSSPKLHNPSEGLSTLISWSQPLLYTQLTPTPTALVQPLHIL